MIPGLREWIVGRLDAISGLDGRVYTVAEKVDAVKPYALVELSDERLSRDSMSRFREVFAMITVQADEVSVAETVAEAIRSRLETEGESEQFWVLRVRKTSGKMKRNWKGYQAVMMFKINIQEK